MLRSFTAVAAMAENNDLNCLVCRRPKKQDNKGTLTQWIVSCNCGLSVNEKSEAEPLLVCQVCFKRITQAHNGTFTQWILRSDSCKCEYPQALLPDTNVESDLDRLENSDLDVDDDADVELVVPIKGFPRDRYKPLAEIGTGALGVVYRCRDRLLGKDVALKYLRSVSPEQMISFQMEARATSQLKHPAIVSVMDFGTMDDGTPYMVMEFIKGRTLEQCLVEQGPLPLDEVVSIFSQAADALAYTHKKGIFHRDLKSANLMIADQSVPDLTVKIIDFGIATIKHAAPEFSQGESIAGTIAYMSPDQALGHPYDERSEIYSLGCVMFEALTGRPPFCGETPLETISMHAHQPPQSLSETAPDLLFPEDIEEVVSKSLAKNPLNRFSSMTEFKEALENIQRSEQSQGFTASVAKPLRRTSAFYLLLASVCMVSIVLFVNFVSAPSREMAAKLNSQAWRQLKAENYDEAIENAQRAVNKDPTYASAVETLALSQLLRGHNEVALITIDEALAIAKANKQRATIQSCNFHRGLICRSLSKFMEGKRNFDASAGYNPEPWELTRFKDLIGSYNLESRNNRSDRTKPVKQKATRPKNSNIEWSNGSVSVKSGNDKDLEQIGKNPSITDLKLFDGVFTESGITHLSSLHLENLHLLSAEVPHTFFYQLNLKKLRSLEITSQSSFKTEILSKLGFENLETLKIEDCNFPDSDCKSILRMKKIQNLQLLRCPQFTGQGWEAMKKIHFQNLGWIPVSRQLSNVENSLATDFALTENLQTSTSKLNEPQMFYPHKYFKDFLSSDSLVSLTLDSDFIDKDNCEQLARISHLQTLDLSGNRHLTTSHVALLNKFPLLSQLTLKGPILHSFSSLSQLRSLKHLSLTNVDLSPLDFKELAKLKLQSLQISQVTIHDESLGHLKAMKSLKRLSFGAGILPGTSGIGRLRQELPECLIEINPEHD